MPAPKIRSYIRLVTIFFLLFALFFTAQPIIFYFGFARHIIPFYNREKQEMALHIKEEILREAAENPNFSLAKFIQKYNMQFKRLNLQFVPGLPKFSANHKTQGSQIFKRRPGNIEAIPLQLKQESGYLVLTSGKFSRLNAGLNFLIAFMFFTVLPSFIIGFLIFRKMNRRSEVLVNAVRRVSQGDYSTRVTLPGNDEFSQIGRAFNEMTASVEQYTRELKTMDLQRRQFIADISHELSTPLTSIKGYVETLQMEELGLSGAEQQQYLQIVQTEADRLAFLVKGLLELARMDAGTIKLEREEIDCREFGAGFIRRNQLPLKKGGLTLTWDAAPGQLIYADFRRLEQILQNLLDNALKHSAGLDKVEVQFTEDGRQSVIQFSDNGSGIAPEHLNRVFERFYRGTN
ncbi:MAG TPA: HAMP domain-containing sensor histidine kinase, partial [Bacillota bacterium]|nr:HAMP domain-containing sensor histidine kinase [Bacillota bacterium]